MVAKIFVSYQHPLSFEDNTSRLTDGGIATKIIFFFFSLAFLNMTTYKYVNTKIECPFAFASSPFSFHFYTSP